MSVAKDGWTRGVVIAVVCAVCALVLASAGPACGQARVRTLNVTVPREIQDDLRDRAKQFVLWVYPTADADAIHKACSDSFVREIQTVRGLTSVLGPTVGLAGRPRRAWPTRATRRPSGRSSACSNRPRRRRWRCSR